MGRAAPGSRGTPGTEPPLPQPGRVERKSPHVTQRETPALQVQAAGVWWEHPSLQTFSNLVECPGHSGRGQLTLKGVGNGARPSPPFLVRERGRGTLALLKNKNVSVHSLEPLMSDTPIDTCAHRGREGLGDKGLACARRSWRSEVTTAWASTGKVWAKGLWRNRARAHGHPGRSRHCCVQ